MKNTVRILLFTFLAMLLFAVVSAEEIPSPAGLWYCETDEGDAAILLREDGTGAAMTRATMVAEPDTEVFTWSKNGSTVILEQGTTIRPCAFDVDTLTLMENGLTLVYEPADEDTESAILPIFQAAEEADLPEPEPKPLDPAEFTGEWTLSVADDKCVLTLTADESASFAVGSTRYDGYTWSVDGQQIQLVREEETLLFLSDDSALILDLSGAKLRFER